MAADLASNKAMFLQELRQLLPSIRSLNDQLLEKKIGKEKLQEGLELTWDFIENACEGKLTRNERIALVSQAFRCLQQWMNQQEIPVTINTLVNNFHLIPYAVDRAFPFYAQSKLLKYVITNSRVA